MFEPCIHRGERLGEASCGAGAIYLCQLTWQSTGQPMLCGDRIPIDEFVDFEGTMLTPANYTRCPTCPSRVVAHQDTRKSDQPEAAPQHQPDPSQHQA